MKIIELLDHYHNYIPKLASIFGIDFYKDKYYMYVDNYEFVDSNEIVQFLVRNNLENAPSDLIAFWQSLRKVISGAKYDHEDYNYFYVGFDFYNLKYFERDLSDFREMAEISADSNQYSNDGDYSWEYYMHKNGIPLSYEEPNLALFSETGDIRLMIYDGGSPNYPIANNFTEFFEHWLASGCFRGGNFNVFWQEVKDIVPIYIPIEQNKWINFYNKVYHPKPVIIMQDKSINSKMSFKKDDESVIVEKIQFIYGIIQHGPIEPIENFNFDHISTEFTKAFSEIVSDINTQLSDDLFNTHEMQIVERTKSIPLFENQIFGIEFGFITDKANEKGFIKQLTYQIKYPDKYNEGEFIIAENDSEYELNTYQFIWQKLDTEAEMVAGEWTFTLIDKDSSIELLKETFQVDYDSNYNYLKSKYPIEYLKIKENQQVAEDPKKYFEAIFLESIWMDYSQEEAYCNWQSMIKNHPWRAQNCLVAIENVIENPPENFKEMLSTSGWISLYHHVDTENEIEYTTEEYLEWLKNIYKNFKNTLDNQT